MIKEIKALGWKFTDKDDLIDNQFCFVSSEVIKSDIMAMGGQRFIETQTYRFFKKGSYNFIKLASGLGVYSKVTIGADDFFLEDVAINVTKVENGYEAELQITIKEV